MMISSILSPKRLQAPVSNWLAFVFAALSLFGFLDATTLVVEHYSGLILGCPIFGSGCENVLTSSYSAIGGIPVALFGSVYYLAIFILAVVFLDTKRAGIFYLAAWLTPIGFLASLGFLYIQFFIIKSLCFWCLLSAVTSTLLFIFGLIFLLRNGKENIAQQEHV